MTKDEYKTVCKELNIEFHEDKIVATPEQITIKAQLLQKYYPTAERLKLHCGIRPEIIIQVGNKTIYICFPNKALALICWWKKSLPYLGNSLFPLDQVVAETEAITKLL